MEGYEVVVDTHTFDPKFVYPVEGWRTKGSYLVPVYNGGHTPADESPFTEVTIRERAA